MTTLSTKYLFLAVAFLFISNLEGFSEPSSTSADYNVYHQTQESNHFNDLSLMADSLALIDPLHSQQHPIYVDYKNQKHFTPKQYSPKQYTPRQIQPHNPPPASKSPNSVITSPPKTKPPRYVPPPLKPEKRQTPSSSHGVPY